MKAKNLFIATVVVALVAPSAFGSGFEKSIPWGGQTSGLAGIGTPWISGSEALFFNPAGLVGDTKSKDVSFNLSPTMPEFKAPILNAGVQESAKKETLYPLSLMWGNTINDKLGYGFGFYVAGGLSTNYKAIALPTSTTADIKAALTITELALGVGYKIDDKLKVGGAWRVGMATAELSSVEYTGLAPNPPFPPATPSFGEGIYKDLKASNYLGFKLGAQYKLNDKTNLGFSYRSEMTYETKGKLTTYYHAASTRTQLSEKDAKLGTLFPAAWTLGVEHKLNDMWKLYGEYVMTEYSKVTNISTEVDGASDPIELKWKDQTNIRVAAAYNGFAWPVRVGYVWTSQVTSKDHSLPQMIPPGPATTYTVGTGQSFGPYAVNAGYEYTTVSGTATGKTAKNEVSETAIHLGGSYTF